MLAAGDGSRRARSTRPFAPPATRWDRSSSWTSSGSTSTWLPRWASSSGARRAGDPLAERFRPSPIQERLVAAGPARPEDGRGLLPLRARRAGHRAGVRRPRVRAFRRRSGRARPRRRLDRPARSPSGSRSRSSTRRTGRSVRASRPSPTSTWRCAWAPAIRSGRSNEPRSSVEPERSRGVAAVMRATAPASTRHRRSSGVDRKSGVVSATARARLRAVAVHLSLALGGRHRSSRLVACAARSRRPAGSPRRSRRSSVTAAAVRQAQHGRQILIAPSFRRRGRRPSPSPTPNAVDADARAAHRT